jgi:hypothetical protein
MRQYIRNNSQRKVLQMSLMRLAGEDIEMTNNEIMGEELGKLAYQIMELQFENRMLRAKILGVNTK